MTAPKRVQMTRNKPWRDKHPDAVIVARPSQWGNPWKVGDSAYIGHQTDHSIYQVVNPLSAEQCVALYRFWVTHWSVLDGIHPLPDLAALAGKDLACWCPLDQPCHADVLLELANPEAVS